MNVFADSGGVPVIKVGDDCYELVGVTDEAANVTPEDTFETCEECEGSSTASDDVSSGSSVVSSAAPSSEASSEVSSEAPGKCLAIYIITWDCELGDWSPTGDSVFVTCETQEYIDGLEGPLDQWVNTTDLEGDPYPCDFLYREVLGDCSVSLDNCPTPSEFPPRPSGPSPGCCPSSASSDVSSDVSSAVSSDASSLSPHVIVTTYNVSYDCATESFGVVTKNNTICHPEDPGDLIAFNQWFWLNNVPSEGGGVCGFEYHATAFTSCNPSGGPFVDVPAPGALPTDLELCLCPSDESSTEISSEASSAGCAEPATCGTPNGDPTLLVTLTWTDSDETKSWLGCTWCNGQEKAVYADTYDLYTGQITPTFTSRVYSERWRLGPAAGPKLGMRRGIRHYGSGTSPATFVPSFYYLGANVTVQTVLGAGKKDTIFRVDSTGGTMTGPYMYNSDLGILSLGDMPASGDYKLLGKQKTNSYTDANGVTYSWKPGTGW